MSSKRELLIEGLTPEAILCLSEKELHGLIFTGAPIVFRAGSAEILGQFRLAPDRLVVELAQIVGGGEGALPALWLLAARFAAQRGLSHVEWIVHAVDCAKPNLKLRRVLEHRGFQICNVPGVGEAYYYLSRSAVA